MRSTDADEKRIESAYRRYADMLYRVALAHVGSPEDAEDAVHDAFVKYMQSSPDFSDESHERAWLIRVTINRTHDLYRRRSTRSYVELSEAGEIAAEESHGAENGVTAIVSTLPDKYKSVIVLHHLEGYSVEETAASLGISESAVKMRLSRGRDMLRKAMEKEGYRV